MVKKTSGPKRDEVNRGQHNEGLYDLYSSSNITRVIKSRRRWAGHVEQTGKRRMCIHGFGVERYHLEDIDVDGKIILEWILKNSVWRSRKGRIGLRVGANGGFLRRQG